MSVEAEAFIAHFGKKGMRWGIKKQKNLTDHERKKVNKSSSKYSNKESLAIVGATGAAFMVSRRLRLNLPITSVVVASTAVGVANRINSKKGAIKVKDLPKG